jgi:ABC-2 type transport system ATP-binding protein
MEVIMQYVLETKNLEKRYRDFKAISNLNIHVEKGAIYGLIGKNGAGKTTLIRLVCGLQRPTSGTYSIYGIENTSREILEERKRIGAIVESPSIYLDLTARENMEEQYQILGLPSYDSIDELLNFVGLENTGKKKAKNFSLGMKQRLGIAIALAGNPDFLMLDEPINGLDPQGIVEIRELILKLNKEKKITVLISSHYLDELSKIATYYGFMDNGQIIKEISSEELNTLCKKRIEIKVSDDKECVKHLEEEHISYEVVDKNVIHIFENINVSKLSLALAKRNCEINEIHEKDESLENYYLNLLGGKSNE